MKNLTKLFALAVVVLGFSATSFGQKATATATGTVSAGVSIANATDLDFGTFIPGASGGTVVVTPEGGVSKTVDVVLVSGGSAASFTVTGTLNHGYGIILPVNGYEITDGTNIMTIGTWTSTPTVAAHGLLDGAGTQTLLVGATLAVGTLTANPAGVYTGVDPFEVTVTYE